MNAEAKAESASYSALHTRARALVDFANRASVSEKFETLSITHSDRCLFLATDETAAEIYRANAREILAFMESIRTL